MVVVMDIHLIIIYTQLLRPLLTTQIFLHSGHQQIVVQLADYQKHHGRLLIIKVLLYTLGTILLEKLEDIASKNNIKNIFLHSRENAIDFYKKNGYIIEKKSHLLFNEVQHWLMKKELK